MAANAELSPSGHELRFVWRQRDSEVERDAIHFWRRLNILPPDVTPEERAKELIAAAYKDGRLVGVTTGVPQRLDFLRAEFVMIRGAVDPDHRRGHAGIELALFLRRQMERWAADHPQERIGGLAAIIESPELIERQRQPHWPQTGFSLVGYTPDGRQVRVSWFEHFHLD